MKQCIVVTGASSGIGAALTAALGTEGHTLYACARRNDRLNEVTRNNTVAFGRPCDVSDEKQVIEFVRWVSSQTPLVDVLINCAGMFGAIGPLVETDSDEWLEAVRVNLYGSYLMIKHLVPLLARAQSPRIINFAGGGAFSPLPNYSAYAVSKAAVVRMTETLAVELAPKGIKVNAVAPGFVATEIHDATLRSGPAKAGAEQFERTRKLLQAGSVPIEVPVTCVQFLLSDQAAELTGKSISAGFDPWSTPVFPELIPRINQSDLYTLRRINPVNLPDSDLHSALSSSYPSGGASETAEGAGAPSSPVGRLLSRLERIVCKLSRVNRSTRWSLACSYAKEAGCQIWRSSPFWVRAALFNRVLMRILIRMLKGRVEFFGISGTIGDMGIIDYYLKRKLYLKSRVVSIYLANKPHVANPYLARFQKHALGDSRTIFVMNRFFCFLLEPLERPLFFAGPKENLVQHPSTFNKLNPKYDFHLERKLPMSERRRGRKLMEEGGLPIDTKFVCVHARECYKAGEQDGHNHYRFSDILTYIPAIQYLTQQGYWVVRMGEPTGKPLPKLENVIDYARTPLKSDFLDVVLVAESELFVGCNSGLSMLAHMFHKPALWSNSIPIDICPYDEFFLWMPKLIYSRDRKRYLTYPEVISLGIGKFHRTQQYEAANLEIHDNSAEDILEATKELHRLYLGDPNPGDASEEDVRIQESLNQLFPEHYYSQGAVSKICASFVKRRRELFPIVTENGRRGMLLYGA